MFHRKPRIGQELLDVPMGEMIRDMAFAIAEAQLRLDENSIEVAEMMGGLKAVTAEVNGQEYVNFEDSRVFFGKEKLSLNAAVAAHNSTSDQGYRASIINSMGPRAEEENVVEITGATLETTGTHQGKYTVTFAGTVPASDKKNASKYYVNRAGTTDAWYKFDVSDGGKDFYTKLESKPKDVLIKLANGYAAEDFVYVPQRVSMMELGFAPTFYQFVDTIIEVKISIKYTQEGSASYERTFESKNKTASGSFGFRRGFHANTRRSVSTSQVNASYSQKYSYSAEGSSLLRTKLVPIPPPAILEERIRLQMDLAREEAAGDS